MGFLVATSIDWSRCSCRGPSAAGSGNTGRLGLHDRVMHARYPPPSVRLSAHRHTSCMQPLARGFDGELVLVPDGVAYGVKCAFVGFQKRWRSLMKVAIAEIAQNLFAALKIFVHGE